MECILIGDTGSGNNDQYLVANSTEKLIKKYPKIRCVILVGDNIYENGCTSVEDKQFITKFQEPYKNINLPFYLCLGNHDYGNSSHNSQIQIQYTFSELNTNKKWNLPHNWYIKSFPSCDIFFIDTNFDWLSPSQVKQQLNTIIKGINKSKKKWKILCGHHTWRTVGGHGNAEIQFETFMNNLLQQVSIDLYVCGHDHCKSIIQVGNHKTHTLVIGTGGKSYDERLFYPENMNHDNSILHYFSPNLGVCHMKCNSKSLTLTCYNEKLQKEYQYTIKKK